MKSVYLEEVCRILNAESSTVLELAQTGQLPGARIGRSWVFLEDIVYDFLRDTIVSQTATRLGKKKIIKALQDNPGINPVLVGAQYEPQRRGRARRELPKFAN